MKLLVTGGVRSGKTRYALHRAEAAASQQIYVATGRAGDDEMQARIARHQRERGPTWTTVEAPLALATTLAALPSDRAVLVDCLTLWLANLLLACPDDDLDAEFGALARAVAETTAPLVLVTNEVGFGIVPTSPLGRRFRDLAGLLGQRIAAVCDEVVLVVAGLPLTLKAP